MNVLHVECTVQLLLILLGWFAVIEVHIPAA